MTIGSALRWAQEQLLEVAGDDAPADARLFVCAATNTSHERILLSLGAPIQRRQEEGLREMIRRRREREPAQYIVGTAQFMGNLFLCDQRALIPRFETEMLALEATRRCMAERGLAVLDVCTGSGCLAVTIAQTGAAVTAADFSEDALMLAAENARRHGVAVEFYQGDLFGALPEGRAFDMIVSNPPYVRSGDIASLAAEVAGHEPHIALDGGADGLLFYRRIAAEAHPYLRPGGRLLLEMGEGQADAVRALFKPRYHDIEILPDMRGIDRIFSAVLRS